MATHLRLFYFLGGLLERPLPEGLPVVLGPFLRVSINSSLFVYRFIN